MTQPSRRQTVTIDALPLLAADLTAYGSVSAAFEVSTILDVEQHLEGYWLKERRIDRPFVKDYDLIPGNDPSSWPGRFAVATWSMLAASVDGVRLGAAVVVPDAATVLTTIEGRDAAVLWDLRVAPQHRGEGVGRALFAMAERWARAQGKRQLLVETQNINVAACRFYEAMACDLINMEHAAYPEFPEEVRLI